MFNNIISVAIRGIKFLLVFLFPIFFGSCSEVNKIYIDIQKQAIVSCSIVGLKRITITNDSSNIILEGTGSIVYFNQVNAASETSVNGKRVNDYKLRLMGNCSYTVTKDNGYDRGPIKIKFRTDSSGIVIMASKTTCN
jgi:hypothetical protein